MWKDTTTEMTATGDESTERIYFRRDSFRQRTLSNEITQLFTLADMRFVLFSFQFRKTLFEAAKWVLG